jgi:hypothetical protein
MRGTTQRCDGSVQWDREERNAEISLQPLAGSDDQNIRQIMAQAALLQDWTARQLSVLSNTYPGWRINREKDPSGHVWWKADLLRQLTVEMVTAGVVQIVRRPDPIALASALAWQSHLVHNTRSGT